MRVMWSCRYSRCGYNGHAYQLERKLHGWGRGEKNGEEQERERDNREKSASGETCGHFGHFLINTNSLMRVCQPFALPNFAFLGKEGKRHMSFM